MSKKLINLSNLQKFLLKLNERFALKKVMKGISEDSEGNIIIGEEGLVPTPDENSKGKFLRSDGTWSIPGDSPLYEPMTQEEGIEGVSEVNKVLSAKTLKVVVEDEISTNENVVHTSSNEEVGGVKTFTENMYIKRDGPRFRLQDTRCAKGTTPESSFYNQALYVFDANHVAYGGLEHSYLNDASNQISMISFSGTTNDNVDYAKITVGYDKNGKWYTYAPTPADTDKSTKIATTEFVSKKDENVVHKSGNETITGLKTFERNGNFIDTKNSSVYLGCNPTSNQHQWINFLDKNGEQTGFISNCHYPGGANVIEFYAKGKYKDGKPDPAGEVVSTMFRVGVNNAGEKYMYTTASWGCDFIPRANDTYTLGNSSFKWKSIYGNLVGNADSSTYLTAQANTTMPTGTTALPRIGMYHQKLYNDTGYPIKYGNLINVQGKDVGGSGQLLLGWSGTSEATENIYYRNKRDTADAKWSEWRQIAFVEDLESKCKCLPLKGGTLTGKLTLKQTSLAMSVKDSNSETIRTNDVLLAKSSNTEYGLNVGLGGLGNTVVGAGESVVEQLNELEGNSQENLFLTADNGVYFKVGANTFANAKTVTLSATAELSGLAKVTSTSFVGALTGNADTSTQFSANKSVTLTGDVTGTASSKGGWSVATTLAKSGVTAGTYGPSANVTGNNNSTVSIPQITVDAKGRVTSVVNRTLTCKNNTYTVPTKVSQLTNDSKFVTLTALGSGSSNGMQATEVGSVMLCTCNCSVLETTSSSIQSNRSLQVPGSYLTPISWMETSGGNLVRTSPEGSSYSLSGTWRLLGNFQNPSNYTKIYYVGLFMRVL
jgi:hypothetical protein